MFFRLVILYLLICFLGRAAHSQYFSFDLGENLEMGAGTADFCSNMEVKVSGLQSTGGDSVLHMRVPANANFGHLFADSPWGKAFRIGVDFSSLQGYSARVSGEILLSTRSGSISLCLMPENWHGQDQKRHEFLFARGNDTQLQVFCEAGGSLLHVVMGSSLEDSAHVTTSISDWKPGKWHFLTISWNPQVLILYMDGERAALAARGDVPENTFTELHFGCGKAKEESGLSLLDEVIVRNSEVEAAHLKTEYQRLVSITNRPAPLSVTIGRSPAPSLDGIIEENEYSFSLNISFDPKTQKSLLQNQWYFSHDCVFLYFGATTPTPEPDAELIRQSDGDLWLNDSVELYVEQNDKLYQFIINADGVVYDSENGIKSWNCQGLKKAVSCQNNEWTVEIAVPLAELGICNDEALYVNSARAGQTGASARLSSLSPVLRSFSHREKFAMLRLSDIFFSTHWNFQKLPGNSGRLDLLFSGNTETSLRFRSRDKGRLIFDETLRNLLPEPAPIQIKQSGVPRSSELMFTASSEQAGIQKIQFQSMSNTIWTVQALQTDRIKQQIQTTLRLQSALPKKTKIIQQLIDQSGKAVREEKQILTDAYVKPFFPLSFPLLDIAPGLFNYRLDLLFPDQDQDEFYQQHYRISGETPVWQDFSKQLPNRIPAPWFPPKIDGKLVHCLSQQYDFSSGLLPVPSSTAGKLLSGAAKFLLNGVPLNYTYFQNQIRSEDGRSVIVEAEAQTKELLLSSKCIIEYDGLVDIELTIAPRQQQGCRIDSLSLTLPFRNEFSQLVSALLPLSRPRKYPSGALGEYWEKDILQHSAFWVGNGNGGLFWGAENLQGSHIQNPEKSMYINKNSAGEATAFIKLIDSRLMLKQKRTLRFYLQATPFRKPDKQIRKTDKIYRPMIINDWHSLFNYSDPDFIDKVKLQNMIRSQKKAVDEVYHYSTFYGVAPYGLDWGYWGSLWIASPPELGRFKIDFPSKNQADRDKNTWAFGCMNCQSFLDYSLYYLNQAIQDKQIAIENLYFDMAYARNCNNPLHGCAWVDDFGVRRTTLNLSGTRKFAQQCKSLLQEKSPSGKMMFHVSGEPIPMVCSIADFIIDGEDFVAQIAKKESYYDIFTPDVFQTCYTGHKFGSQYAYIPQFGRAAYMFNPSRTDYWRKEQKAPAAVSAVRHFIGYCLIHDTVVFSSLGVWPELNKLSQIWQSFGWDEQVSFHPYWQKPVASSEADILISGYRRPGRMLLVILNDSDKQRSPLVKLAELRPQSKISRIYDPENMREFPCLEAGLTLEMPARGLRLIVLEWQQVPDIKE